MKTLWIGLPLLLLGAGVWTLRGPLRPAPAPAALSAARPGPGPSLADKAITKNTAAVQKNAQNGPAWVDLGNALMQKARETADLSCYGRAEAAYRKALALDPQAAPALIGMAWVTSDRHEFEKSKDWARRALAREPRSNDAYGLLGDADQELGDYNAAFAHYQAMLNIRPDLASYSRGGHLLWLNGNFRTGASLMLQAIDAGGAYTESTGWCRAQLGLMLWSEGHQAAAEQTLRDALSTAPNNYRVLMALGRVEAGRGDLAAATGHYERAVAVVPQLEAVAALGDLYDRAGRKAEAEDQYALAEKIDQIQKANGVRGGWQMSLFRANHGRDLPLALREAQEEYQTRRNVYAADTLAWCLYKSGRYDEAAALSRAALARHTPEADFLFHAGMIAAARKDVRAARLSLRQALALNPRFSPVDAPAAALALRRLG